MTSRYHCANCGASIVEQLAQEVGNIGSSEAANYVKAAKKAAKYKSERKELRGTVATLTAQVAGLKAELAAAKSSSAPSTAAAGAGRQAGGPNASEETTGRARITRFPSTGYGVGAAAAAALTARDTYGRDALAEHGRAAARGLGLRTGKQRGTA